MKRNTYVETGNASLKLRFLHALTASMKSHDQIYTKNINIYNTDYNEYKNYVL